MPEVPPPEIDQSLIDPIIIEWRRGKAARKQKALERRIDYIVLMHMRRTRKR